MLLVFDDDHKRDLAFLRSLSSDVVANFAHLASDFLANGVKPKLYQAAANKLDADVDEVRRSVEGLMHLYTEAVKLSLSELDFQDSTLSLGLDEPSRAELYSVYAETRSHLRRVLDLAAYQPTHFHSLEWRLDVQVASRSLLHQIDPLILLNLTLETGRDSKSNVLLQTDPVNLLHMTTQLETALAELKSHHCRRITRLLK